MDYFLPQFFAPQLTPPEFLLVSSATERKVVYTEMKNFKSKTGRTWALVDSGLQEPRGIAFDRQRGYLYVADRGAGRIFRYQVLVRRDPNGGLNSYSLVTDGVQITIRQVPNVEWVSVDVSGAVFYSDPGSQAIYKIPGAVAEAIGNGDYGAADLQVVTETELEASLYQEAQASLTQSDQTRSQAQPTDAPDSLPRVYALYQGASNPQVSAPHGVVSDGLRLYWANGAGGASSGNVVMGEANPQPRLGALNATAPPRLPASVLSNATASPYGIAKSNTMIFFSTNVTGSGTVYGVSESGDSHAFAQGLVEPRGLVWDGDQTVYVADQASNNVWSFPVGRIIDGAPLTRSVALSGAFGVALFSATDPAFQNEAGAHKLSVIAPLTLAFGAAWLGRIAAQ